MSAIINGVCNKCDHIFCYSYGHPDWYSDITGFGIAPVKNKIKINRSPAEAPVPEISLTEKKFWDLRRKQVCDACDPEPYKEIWDETDSGNCGKHCIGVKA